MKTVKKLEHYDLIANCKITLEDEVINTFIEWTRYIPNNEIVGAVFYNLDADYNVHIVGVHFFHVTPDTSTMHFTEVDFPDDLFMYKDMCGAGYIGMIHTHCNAGTGFSGPDLEMMYDEDTYKDYPIFLSVIINNLGSLNAKLAYVKERVIKIDGVQDMKDKVALTRNYSSTFKANDIPPHIKQLWDKRNPPPVVGKPGKSIFTNSGYSKGYSDFTYDEPVTTYITNQEFKDLLIDFFDPTARTLKEAVKEFNDITNEAEFIGFVLEDMGTQLSSSDLIRVDNILATYLTKGQLKKWKKSH